jgi:hypothetical protein
MPWSATDWIRSAFVMVHVSWEELELRGCWTIAPDRAGRGRALPEGP